ncbi:MAG: SGNH/GDSL hydrolase family protein, partial [Oscillospiraceae bacterium]
PESLFHVINTGTGGDTSSNLLARWECDVINIAPDYLVVCIGINDIWRQFDTPSIKSSHVSIEMYEQNLKKYITQTREKINVKEIIFMTPYFMEPNKEDLMRKKTDEYGNVMKKVAKEMGVTLIDLQKEFDDYLKFRHSSYIMWDRVHPGHIGNLIIAKAFLKQMGFDRPII